MAEHLTRPPIDEERLMKIREKDKIRRLAMEKSGTTKRLSIMEQKIENACNKNKSDIKIKIVRAEKNMKNLFIEMKKLIKEK